jgi:hypothetical protein
MKTEASSPGLSGMAKLVLALIILLILAAIVWRGPTFEGWERVWANLTGRLSGPMKLRLFLQPTMSLIAALHDGMKDARTGRPPYFFTVLTDPRKRMPALNEGLVSTARVLFFGILVDTIYQIRVFKTFYPGEALFTALLLAFVPYLLLRGPISRIARRMSAHKPGVAAS